MTGLALDVYTSPMQETSTMQRRYPDHGNPSALILSVVTAFKDKKHAADPRKESP